MKTLLGFLLAPYKAWIKAQEDIMSEIMKMEEPDRSNLLSYLYQDLTFPVKGGS